MRITRIGGPTVLVELRGWRILVDPTFDPPGRRYPFALGTSSVKTTGPALRTDEVLPVDIVFVSHDHHADNLDDAGRGLLARVPRVFTTRSGAIRLGHPGVTGMRAGESILLPADEDRAALEVTATPCRHGPPLSRAIVGDVIGFAVRAPGAARHDLWVTGDTVLTSGVRRVARSMDIDVAVVNAGGVRFPQTGPITYSMTGRAAVRLVAEARPRVAVPAHFDGWSHFRDGERGMREAMRAADPATKVRIRWLTAGIATEL